MSATLSPTPRRGRASVCLARRWAAGCVVSLAIAGPWGMLAQAQQPPQLKPPALVLLTEAEAVADRDRERQQPPVAVAPPRSRSLRPPAPVIRVIAPSPGGETVVPTPLRLEFGFNPAPGTRIVPSSFRLLYGVLRIDLTERLRAHASVSEQGVLLERAQMPPGTHRLWIQVGDDQGNVGEQELRFRIASGS